MDKEMMFLNDFEYDDSAAKWVAWQYLKTFLEGDEVTVGIPKCRGGNKKFESDAPVFMTAPQVVSLMRGKKLDKYETEQMGARITYIYLTHAYEEANRIECKPCGLCGARLYLEGSAANVGYAMPSRSSSSSAARPPSAVASDAAAPSSPKRRRTGVETVGALRDLKTLKDDGLLDTPEFKLLKSKVLSDS
jgi:hypothetical protein